MRRRELAEFDVPVDLAGGQTRKATDRPNALVGPSLRVEIVVDQG